MTEENMDLWNSFGATDPRFTSELVESGGFKGTSVKPIYVQRLLTERFGPLGIGWGWEELKTEVVTAPVDETGRLGSVWYSLVKVWVKDGEQRLESYGRGGCMITRKNGLDHHAASKALTHAWKKGFTGWGLMADVFLNKFKDPKYVEQQKKAAEKADADRSHENASKLLRRMLKDFIGCEDERDEMAVIAYACDGQPPTEPFDTEGMPSRILDRLKAIAKKMSYPKILSIAKGKDAA